MLANMTMMNGMARRIRKLLSERDAWGQAFVYDPQAKIEGLPP
jgi:hypothetical protein